MDLMNFMYNDTKTLVMKIIIFIIIFLVILDQIVSLTIFVYNYNKYYDYGTMMRTTCDTNYTEYETERFQVAQNMMKIKLGNDNTNDRYHIIIIILSIILALYINYFLTFMYLESLFTNFTSTISKAFTATNSASSATSLGSSSLVVINFFKEEINEFLNKHSTLEKIVAYILTFIKVAGAIYLIFMLPISIIVKLAADVDISPFAKTPQNIIPHTIMLTLIMFTGLIQGNNVPVSYFAFIFFFALYIVIYEYSMIISDIYMHGKNSRVINIYENSENDELKNMTFSQYYYGNTNTGTSIIMQMIMNTFGMNNMKVSDFKLNFQTNYITKAILESFGYTFDESKTNPNTYDYNPINIDNYNVVLLLFAFSVMSLIVVYMLLLAIEHFDITFYRTFSGKKLDSKVVFYFAFIPMLFIFITLFVVLITKEYNTMVNKYILYEPHSLYKQNIHKVSGIFNQLVDNDKSSVVNDSVCPNITNALHLVLYANLFKNYDNKKMFVPKLSYVSVCNTHDFIDYTKKKEYDFKHYVQNIFYNDSKCISVNNELLTGIMKSIIPKFAENLTEKDYTEYRHNLIKQFRFAVYNIINKKTYEGSRRLEITNDYHKNNTIVSPDTLLKDIIDTDKSVLAYSGIINDIADEYIIYNKTIYTYTIRIIQALCRCNDIADFTTQGYDVIMAKIDNTINNQSNSTLSFSIKKTYITKYKEITGLFFDILNEKLTSKIKTSVDNRKLSKYIIDNYNNYITDESYKFKKDELVLLDSKLTNALNDTNKYSDIDKIQAHIETLRQKVDELAELFKIDIKYDPDNPDVAKKEEKEDISENTTLIVEKTLEIEEIVNTLQQTQKNYQDIFKSKYYYSQDLNKQLIYDYKMKYIDSMINLHKALSQNIRNNYNFFQKYDFSYSIKGFTDVDMSAIKKQDVQEFDYIKYKKEYTDIKLSYENRYNTLFKLANDIFKIEMNDIKYKELDKQEKHAQKLFETAKDTSFSVYALIIIYVIIIIMAYYIQ